MTGIFDIWAHFFLQEFANAWVVLVLNVIKEVQDQPRHEYFFAITLYSIAAVTIVITILKAVEQLQYQLKEES